MKASVRLLIAFVLLGLACQAFAQVASSKKTLTLETIFADGGITGRPPETIQWTPDGSRFSFVQRDDSGEHGELWYVDAATGEKKLLVSESKLSMLSPAESQIRSEREKERVTRYHVAAYHWAPDSKHLLFDSLGQLWLYSLETGTGVQFTSDPEPSVDPKFSPDGSRVAFVRAHNLYVRPIEEGPERQLTRDKDPNLLNGEVDWVYAEELATTSNYFWSPDGKQIAYLQMNETQVPEYPITDWLPAHAKVDFQKYPKPGDSNPAVRIGVVSASGGKTRWLPIAEDRELYIPRFGWVRDGVLWAEVLNRTQDELDLIFVDTETGKSRLMLKETVKDSWVNVNDDFHILKSSQFLWSSWRDGHTHLYLYRFDPGNPLGADASLQKQLTQGDFEVLSVAAVDESSGTVYFSCNKDDPRQTQLYSVKLDGSAMQRVSQDDGTHTPTFAPDAKHYVDDFSSVTSPQRISLCGAGGSCQAEWASRSVDEYTLLKSEFLNLSAADGTPLYGQLMMPPDVAAGSKIPLIVNVYGGPAAQLVVNRWDDDRRLFRQILAAHGFAVFSVDNRGTPGRDRNFQTAIRGQMGGVELKDQLDALEQLFSRYPQLDRSKVAIWGWSNGGFMTLYALTHSGAFKAGVAVAPVTDWRSYDSIYTERYLGLLKDNRKGYDDASPVLAAGHLQGELLLAHGTSDDNVHLQNSIQMIEALITAGKQFRFMPYPNKTHRIAGRMDRIHLFQLMLDHFEHELK